MLSLTVHDRVLKFHIWSPDEKTVDTCFFVSFLSRICAFPELWPLENTPMKYCQHNISKTIETRALKPSE